MKFLPILCLITIFSQTAAWAQNPVGQLDGNYRALMTAAEEGVLCSTMGTEVTPDVLWACGGNNICSFFVRLRPQGTGWRGTLINEGDYMIDSGGIYGTGCEKFGTIDHLNVGEDLVEITPLQGPDQEGSVTLFQVRALVPELADHFAEYYQLEEY